MNKKIISLGDALKISLPKMVNDKKSLNVLIEIMEECFYENKFNIRDNIVHGLTGKGDFGEFPIDIHEYHGIFWISAPEFDDDGYFTCLDDAISFAEERYEPFISRYLSGDD